MLDRRTIAGLRWWRLLVPAIGGAWTLTACEGKVRPYKLDPEKIVASNQPDAGVTAAGAPGPSSPTSSSDSQEGQPTPGGFANSEGQAGAKTDDDVCLGDAGAGSCPPRPLCSPDAGAVCEATCPGCFVDETCVASDAVNPDNPCLICSPGLDPRGWSNNDGGSCDDGLFCTTDDVCRTGSCVGTLRECDDGVACNGVSTCLEDSDSCSPPINQCGNDAICDVATDTCRSTCVGCVVAGVCVLAGAEAPGNPCRVCDPARAATAYTIAAGKSCGAAATACSGQDTCDGQGRCQPNNLPANTACGNPNSSACDQPDACDGNGNCQQRVAANGTPCDDGAFCTTGDQCQGGQCGPTGQQNCGLNRICNEAANQCQCQGCQVGNSCFAAGAANPTNPCQVCDPNRSATAFSANTGAQCGAAATNCSGQDTCNAQGQCAPNNFAEGMSCNSPPGGSCRGGQCVGCAGCQIGNNCVATGSQNPQNACQVCDPSRSATAYSVNAGATCGSGPTECSGQDTCNAQGQCVANDFTNGTACTPPLGGSCQGGSCVACSGCVVGASCIAVGVACTGNRVCAAGGQCVPPFVCGEASPPRGAFPPEQVFTGSLTGGTILDGAYVETQQLQPAGAFTLGQSFAFRGPFVHLKTTEFFDASDPGGPADEAVGTFTTNGNMLTMGLINCETGGTLSFLYGYSASSTRLDLIGMSIVSTSGRFVRQ